MKLMIEVGRRSNPQLFNEVCLPGEKLVKPVAHSAYFSKIGFGGKFAEPLSKHTFYEDYSFSAINTIEFVSSKKGTIRRKHTVADLCKRKVNLKEICNFHRRRD